MKIIKAMDTSDGFTSLRCDLQSLLQDMEMFSSKSAAILEDFSSIVEVSVSNITRILGPVNAVEPLKLFHLLDEISGSMQNMTIADPDINLSDSILNPSRLTADISSFQKEIREALNQINSIKAVAVETIIASSGEFQYTIQKASDTIKSIYSVVYDDTVSPFIQQITPVVDFTHQYTPMVFLLYAFLFLGFLSSLLMAIFMCIRKPLLGRKCNSVTWVLVYMFVIIGFLTSGGLVPTSQTYSDICSIVDVIPTNASYYASSLIDLESVSFGGINPRDALDGCFAEPHISLADSLDFSLVFDFDSFINSTRVSFTSNLTFIDELNDAAGVLNGSAVSGFPNNLTTGDDILVSLNRLMSSSYSTNNCTATVGRNKTMTIGFTCAPDTDAWFQTASIDDAATARELRSKCVDKIIVEVTAIQINKIMAEINEMRNILEANLTSMNEAIENAIAASEPVSNNLNSLLDSFGDCSFVKENYQKFYLRICGDVFQGLRIWITMIICASTLGLVAIVCSVFVEIRCFGNSGSPIIENPKVDDNTFEYDNESSFQETSIPVAEHATPAWT